MKMPRKIIALLLMTALSLLFCGQAFAADDAPGQEDRDTPVRVAMLQYPNFIDYDENRKPSGFSCVTAACAESGKIGVAMFAQSPPGFYDAILMDIRMPVMNGMEATKAIRALPRPDAGEVPIIAMTANAFDEDARASMEAGMNGHLTKPIDPSALYKMLAASVEGKGSR